MFKSTHVAEWIFKNFIFLKTPPSLFLKIWKKKKIYRGKNYSSVDKIRKRWTSNLQPCEWATEVDLKTQEGGRLFQKTLVFSSLFLMHSFISLSLSLHFIPSFKQLGRCCYGEQGAHMIWAQGLVVILKRFLGPGFVFSN